MKTLLRIQAALFGLRYFGVAWVLFTVVLYTGTQVGLIDYDIFGSLSVSTGTLLVALGMLALVDNRTQKRYVIRKLRANRAQVQSLADQVRNIQNHITIWQMEKSALVQESPELISKSMLQDIFHDFPPPDAVNEEIFLSLIKQGKEVVLQNRDIESVIALYDRAITFCRQVEEDLVEQQKKLLERKRFLKSL